MIDNILKESTFRVIKIGELKESDLIVIEYPKQLEGKVAGDIRNRFSEIIGNQKIVILTGGLKISKILRKE